jgi:hypothetical protein
MGWEIWQYLREKVTAILWKVEIQILGFISQSINL